MTGSRVEPAADRATDVALAAALAALLRESLAAGTDTAGLEAMLRAVAEARGCPFLLLARGIDDHLELVTYAGPEGYEIPVRRLHESVGMAGEAYRTGQPVVIEDARADPRWYDIASDHRSGMAVPMRLPDRVWGVLVAESTEVAAFDRADAAALVPLADELAWALETIRLKQEATQRAAREERLRRGFEATAAIISAGLEATDLDSALDRVVRETRDQLGWEAMAIILVEGERMRVAAHFGYEIDVAETEFDVSRGILGHVASTGRPYLAPDTVGDPYYDDVVTTTRSELCVPVVFAGQVRAVLNAETSIPGFFDEDDLVMLMRLAGQLALVMHNLELLESRNETVERLHELDRMKTRLLTISSHELRTPLTVVNGFAETLEQHAGELPGGQVRQYARAIRRQSSSLSQLVDQMLLAAQMEQGQLKLDIAPIELGMAVVEALGDRAPRIEVLEGATSARVMADALRLRQILENLFDNAVKYAGESGRIQVDARRDDDRVVVLVRDEGPGIPGSEHDRVFDAFHQVGEHGVAGRRGMGLGLAVARDLASLMHGTLELASAEGYGATFVLRLPAAP